MENYKLLKEKNGWNEFAKIPTINKTYIVNEEEYNGFILETLGYTTQSEKYNEHMYCMITYIKHNNNELEYIPGAGINVKSSIRKAKKWIDKNGEGLLNGTKQYQHKST